ncbi:MAG: DNA-protecting protein DprA [Candidatus Yanofskybacteria bacterium]|nr:DNA-protecting protein DprA [Candidatus Yanofskybacteria bacterium]
MLNICGMSNGNLKYLNAINILVTAKSGALQAICDAYGGDWEKAWYSDLTRYIPKDRDTEGKLISVNYPKLQKQINPDQEWAKLAKKHIELITILDVDYPKPLSHIPDPPFLLYVRGSREVLSDNCFAIVGTRALSEYGKRCAPQIALDVARAGFTIVSGLAMGIDTLAHKAALDASAKTIAVLGTGIDDQTIFPAPNLGLTRKIIEKGGAIISEYAIGTHGTKFSFPQRNRIISGLSQGVLVVEADEQSGAMITARFAAEQGRDVFAIPGNIFAKTSQGTNNIIKKGAKMVTCAEDILEEYELKTQNFKFKIQIKGDNEMEEKILAVLSGEPITADDIIRQTGLDAAQANATLTVMELKKKVRNLKGRFILWA